jgi:hypothetical protein
MYINMFIYIHLCIYIYIYQKLYRHQLSKSNYEQDSKSYEENQLL